MPERHDRDRLRDEEDRIEFAIRREEDELAAEERRLEREMDDFEADEERAKRDIESEVRKEHLGHEPPRPLAWRDRRRSG